MAIRRLATASAITGSKSSKIWDQETTPTGMFALATAVVPSAGAATIEFSGIPQNYAHLQLRGIFRSDASSSGNNIGMFMRFNGDSSSSHYYWHEMYGSGSSSAGAYGESGTGIMAAARGPRAGDASGFMSAAIIDILDYTSSSKAKVVRSFNGDDLNGSGWVAINSGGWWAATIEGITQINLYVESSNFAQYSHFALYGIKAAS